VVAGIVFLAAEMRQNTKAIQAQTRDSLTEKQMMWLASVYTNPEVADIYQRGSSGESLSTPAEGFIYAMAIGADFREWEDSYYQYERGLYRGGVRSSQRPLAAGASKTFPAAPIGGSHGRSC